MGIIEATVSFLFRPYVRCRTERREDEQHMQKTRSILRDITDPAESVAECLAEQPTRTDRDTATKAAPADRR